MGIHRTYSTQITRATTDVSGTQVVTGLGGKFNSLMIMGSNNANVQDNCVGWMDRNLQACNYGSAVTLLLTLVSTQSVDLTKILVIQTSTGNGWSGLITSMDVDGFTITWTKIGAGLNITCNFTAIL